MRTKIVALRAKYINCRVKKNPKDIHSSVVFDLIIHTRISA